jgi:hypothetical protein
VRAGDVRERNERPAWRIPASWGGREGDATEAARAEATRGMAVGGIAIMSHFSHLTDVEVQSPWFR